jgi:hypothetical protein
MYNNKIETSASVSARCFCRSRVLLRDAKLHVSAIFLKFASDGKNLRKVEVTWVG